MGLNIDGVRRRYGALIGVGGIGTGVFFALNGNHTLGREESRSGRFIDRRDYCKLHIISHYVHTLIGGDFVTLPVGKVGDDGPGRDLLRELAETGFDLRHVCSVPGAQTLYGLCFIYPDGAGGNMTVDNSACALVDEACVRESEPEFAMHAGNGIALAAPEVPLPARRELLAQGTRYGFLRAASFLSEEMQEVRDSGMLASVDVLAINVDEAAALAGIASDGPAATIVARAVAALRERQPSIVATVTAGGAGSWVWDGEALTHLPAFPVDAVSTAGAGDANFAGILVGLAAGLDIRESAVLGTLVAALSVTSPHTINGDIDRASLRDFAASVRVPLSAAVRELL